MESSYVSIMRRIADVVLSLVGLVITIPVFLGISLALLFQDGLPILFEQVRVGRHGTPFKVFKFRSMRTGGNGAMVTAGGDSRITPLGGFLRRYKLDELPQLWNVLKGDMSLIGPRPEVPPYVVAADPRWRRVLAHRPGITDFATLMYRDEESMLAGKEDPERYYLENILPSKLALNIEYLDKRSSISDFKLLFLTLRCSFIPHALDPTVIRQAILSR